MYGGGRSKIFCALDDSPRRRTPDRFIASRRYSDVDASHFKLFRTRSSSVSGSPAADSPVTPEERDYYRRMSLMSSGRSDGGILASAGANGKDVTGEGSRIRILPKSPDTAFGMVDLPDDLYTNGMSWSSRNEIAIAMLRTVYIWSASTYRHRRVKWQLGETHPRSRNRETCDSDASDEEDGDQVEWVVCSVVWHPNGRLLALGLEDGTVRVWDSLNDKRIPVIENRETTCVSNNATNAICWGQNKTIFSGHQCGCVCEVSMLRHTDSTNDVLIEAVHPIANITVSPHHRYLAAASSRQLYIWQLADRSLVARLPVRPDAPVKGLLFLPWQPDLLAYSTCNSKSTSRITVWHVPSESIVAETGSEAQVCSLTANPRTEELLCGHGGSENSISVWSGSDLQLLGKLPGHNCRVLHLAVSPDATKLASCGPDQALKLWSCFDTAAVKSGAPRRRGQSVLHDHTPTAASYNGRRRRSSLPPTAQSPFSGIR